jgi:hypothetical protein
MLSIDQAQIDLAPGPRGILDEASLGKVVKAIGYVLGSDCELLWTRRTKDSHDGPEMVARREWAANSTPSGQKSSKNSEGFRLTQAPNKAAADGRYTGAPEQRLRVCRAWHVPL